MLNQISILRAKSVERIPVVLHIPHSGRSIPEDVREKILLNDESLGRELMAVTDAYTDALFSAGVSLGGVALVNNLSRLAIDPERFPKDEDEVMSGRGRGAVYLRTSDMGLLRNPDTYDEERNRLTITYLSAYNRVITNIVTEHILRFRRCLLMDCHSFPRNPLKCELDQETIRPEICIGTHDSHTPTEIIGPLVSLCHAHGLSCKLNRPFAGTYVPLLWYGNAQVCSIMIEVRRDLYMDESTGKRKTSFAEIKGIIDKMVEILAEYAKSMKPI